MGAVAGLQIGPREQGYTSSPDSATGESSPSSARAQLDDGVMRPHRAPNLTRRTADDRDELPRPPLRERRGEINHAATPYTLPFSNRASLHRLRMIARRPSSRIAAKSSKPLDCVCGSTSCTARPAIARDSSRSFRRSAVTSLTSTSMTFLRGAGRHADQLTSASPHLPRRGSEGGAGCSVRSSRWQYSPRSRS